MENIDDYFDKLNNDILEASTPKALKVLTKRTKKLYKMLIHNKVTKGLKTQIHKQYINSLNLITNMYSKVS